MTHPMKPLLASLLLCGAAAGASAGCHDVPVKLFGLAIGPIATGYEKTLAWGIRAEGYAEIVKDVGFIALNGSNDGVDWKPLMAFVGQGRVDSVVGHGVMSGEKDLGFDKLVARVGEIAGSPASIADGKASFACDDGLQLSLEPITVKGQSKVSLVVKDPAAAARTGQYVEAYCADPQKRRPQDACKK